MAESRRKLDSKKYQKDQEANEEAQKARNRRILIIMGVAAVLIVAGMFLLSQFLSGKRSF